MLNYPRDIATGRAIGKTLHDCHFCAFALGPGTTLIQVSDIGGAQPGTYVLIDYASAPPINLDQLKLANSTLGPYTLSLISNIANTSVDLKVELVPEPSAALLMASALILQLRRRHRESRNYSDIHFHMRPLV